MTEPLELPSLDGRPSMRSQVSHALRAALVAGQLRPGQVYSAPALAGRFGISPTPVREAMLELVKEGLVLTVPNKGFLVRELSDRELDEITEIRLLLEVPSAVKAVGRATPEDLARLDPIAHRIVEVAEAKDLIGRARRDAAPHRGPRQARSADAHARAHRAHPRYLGGPSRGRSAVTVGLSAIALPTSDQGSCTPAVP